MSVCICDLCNHNSFLFYHVHWSKRVKNKELTCKCKSSLIFEYISVAIAYEYFCNCTFQLSDLRKYINHQLIQNLQLSSLTSGTHTEEKSKVPHNVSRRKKAKMYRKKIRPTILLALELRVFCVFFFIFNVNEIGAECHKHSVIYIVGVWYTCTHDNSLDSCRSIRWTVLIFDWPLK